MNWEVISSVGSFISSIAAITAIVIGIYQYRSTIDRTDKQIAYLESEKNQKTEENRPLITIPKSYAAGIKDYWQFKLDIENIGVRPAYDMEIESTVISIDDHFENYELSDKVTYKYANPISKNTIISFIGNIYFKKYDTYFINVSIKYYDTITAKIYKDDFFFKWKNVTDKDYNKNIIYGMLADERDKFNEIKIHLKR